MLVLCKCASACACTRVFKKICTHTSVGDAAAAVIGDSRRPERLLVLAAGRRGLPPPPLASAPEREKTTPNEPLYFSFTRK